MIIGGGSIFGGYGTIIGALAGRGGDHAAPLAAVAADHPARRHVASFMPQHWVNVFIGLILIVAVLGDIWLRQEGILRAASASRLARPAGRAPA